MSGNTSATGGYLRQSNVVVDDSALTDVFTALIVGITGLDATLVRPRWQPSPPTQPDINTDWCAFGVLNRIGVDYPWFQHFPGYDVMSRLERIECQASFIGPNNDGLARRMRDGMYVPQNIETIAGFGIKLYEVGEITEVPNPLINTQYYSQADVPLIFMRQVDLVFPILDVDTMPEIKMTDTGLTVGINFKLP